MILSSKYLQILECHFRNLQKSYIHRITGKDATQWTRQLFDGLSSYIFDRKSWKANDN